jgi:transcriptional activator SPT7
VKGREGSETVDSNGFATPPVAGSTTPSGMNGHSGIGSAADAMDIDGPSLNGMALNQALGEAAEQAYEDEEYKIWKQVTKKDRARVAMERFQLFKDNCLNVEAPAVLRTRTAIRRFLKAQKQYETADGLASTSQQEASATASKPQETLAEEMEEEEVERVIPDYYEPQGIIPSILPTMQWVEDNEGQVINQHEESLRVVPKEHFKSPISRLTKNIESNIRQIQETRKLAIKISVVKQMQIQSRVRLSFEMLVKAQLLTRK